MKAYSTVSEALEGLKTEGFTTDFNVVFDKVECARTGVCLSPSDFEIVAHYRFEGDTDPGDESVIYAIASTDGKTKGTLVTAYGMYSDSISDDMVNKLKMNEA